MPHRHQTALVPRTLRGEQPGLLTECLMGNQSHPVPQPQQAGAMSRLMGWVGVTHVRRHHEHDHARGRGDLYQGRFKSFPIQEDRQLLRVCRYVEANPARAGLVKSAHEWIWSGMRARRHGKSPLQLAPWLVDRPLATDAWTALTVRRLGLLSTVNPVGRPMKKNQ